MIIIEQNRKKKEETLTEKMKRSLDERHTLTHRSLTDMFQQPQMSYSLLIDKDSCDY